MRALSWLALGRGARRRWHVVCQITACPFIRAILLARHARSGMCLRGGESSVGFGKSLAKVVVSGGSSESDVLSVLRRVSRVFEVAVSRLGRSVCVPTESRVFLPREYRCVLHSGVMVSLEGLSCRLLSQTSGQGRFISPCEHFVIHSSPDPIRPKRSGAHPSIAFLVALVGLGCEPGVQPEAGEVSITVFRGGPSVGYFTMSPLSDANVASALSRFIVSILELSS